MNRLVAAIALGGLAAGALDIIYPILVFGPLSFDVPAQRVLQSVAAGLIGREAAVAGGWPTALLGLALHMGMATVMAGVYVLAATRLRILIARAVLFGLTYGLLLYLVMNYIVVPLSAAGDNVHFAASLGEAAARLRDAFSEVQPRTPAAYPWMLPGNIFAHAVLVGLPIALIARRFST